LNPALNSFPHRGIARVADREIAPNDADSRVISRTYRSMALAVAFFYIRKLLKKHGRSGA